MMLPRVCEEAQARWNAIGFEDSQSLQNVLFDPQPTNKQEDESYPRNRTGISDAEFTSNVASCGRHHGRLYKVIVGWRAPGLCKGTGDRTSFSFRLITDGATGNITHAFQGAGSDDNLRPSNRETMRVHK